MLPFPSKLVSTTPHSVYFFGPRDSNKHFIIDNKFNIKFVILFYLYKIHIKIIIKMHTNLLTWYDIAAQTVLRLDQKQTKLTEFLRRQSNK